MHLTLESFINSDLKKELSGEYEDLHSFIFNNSLEREFELKYDIPEGEWDDNVRGEIDADEEIIDNFLDDNYKLYYDNDKDMFIITKKKTNKINYKIDFSKILEILDVIGDSGVESEYEPRFSVSVDNEIVGGSTYHIDDSNIYNFDIGIISEFQGYGISKKLIGKIINDAKTLKCDGIKAQVVNNMLFDYLNSIGFSGSDDSDIKYVYLSL